MNSFGNINSPREQSQVSTSHVKELQNSLQQRIQTVHKLKITGALEKKILKAVNADSSVDPQFKNQKSLVALLQKLE